MAREWITLEQEEVLRELGMENPYLDPVTDELLDAVEENALEAEEDWEAEFWDELLMELEMEV